MKLILLTGAQGRVGFELLTSFKQIGFDVIPISHSIDYSKYHLPSFSALSDYAEIFIVHSGQPNAPRTREARIKYLSATKDLIEDSNMRSLNFVLVSSLSAHKNNRSNYSRDKQYLEELTCANSGLIIKLGLVSGLTNGFDMTIARMRDFLGLFHLSFILTSSTFYYTNRSTIMNVALDLDKFGLDGRSRIYFDTEFYPLTELNPLLRIVRRTISASLSLMSKLGSGNADALLTVMDGMKLPNDYVR
jgi:hypothetical protein